jgi:hypothetical protein
MSANLWSDSEVALARSLWDAGLPSGQIGARIGRTKNAVCGMAKRRHWPLRGAVVSLTPEQLAARAAKTKASLQARYDADGAAAVAAALRRSTRPVIVPPLPAPPPEPVGSVRTCQWIEGDDRRSWARCGALVHGHSVYCQTHHRRCYTRVAA